MAYVVARPRGRYEIRESVHTAKGPRARSLGNFSALSTAVLNTAAARASRPFDPEAVRAAADRLGVPIADAAPPAIESVRPDVQQFVEATRRMAFSLESRPREGRQDPGDALFALLGFVAQITPFQSPRAPEPLLIPPWSRLLERRTGDTSLP
ncbi:MAG TPA: hypothetical protein VHV57_09825 [Acidimicrobiales bacterium]|nr:hypothetical protein [Acidimicrobiales bacterium]